MELIVALLFLASYVSLRGSIPTVLITSTITEFSDQFFSSSFVFLFSYCFSFLIMISFFASGIVLD